MTASRRELLVAGGCAAIAGIVPATPAIALAPSLMLLTDDAAHRAPHGRAILLPPGGFVDDARIAALPPGDYVARLSPANALLLLAVLRSRRVGVDEGGAAPRFSLGRRA